MMEGLEHVNVSVAKVIEVFGTIGIGAIIALTAMQTIMWVNDKRHSKDLNAAFKLIREMRDCQTEMLLEIREMRTKLDFK